MRGFRRTIVSVSWVVLLAWILGLLVPQAGLRVHDHPAGDATHVHLDELIAEAIGHRRHLHPHDHGDSAGHRHVHSRAVQRDSDHRRAARRVPEPATALAAAPAPRWVTAGARASARAELRPPSGAHVHASSPFLLLVLVALAVLLLVTRCVAISAPSPLAPYEAWYAPPRARAPPRCFGGPLQTI